MNPYTPSLLLRPRADGQEVLRRALSHCTARGFNDEELLSLLQMGDAVAHSTFRYVLAEEFCQQLAVLRTVFRAVYIYGSTMNGSAHFTSDVDVLVWVHRKTDTVQRFLTLLDLALVKVFQALVGPGGPERLFDVHLVDDEEVESRRGYGAVLGSIWTAPVCLWHC